MARLWGIDNQTRGIHTKPARVEGGEGYAADIENLRVDQDGFLRLRDAFEAVGVTTETEAITGVAATANFLFVLRANGKLYVSLFDSLDSETEIEGVEDLEGRISVVSPASTYAILTSEGGDQGYWIDLREGEGLAAHPLGIDAPDDDDFTITKYPSDSVVEEENVADLRLLGPDIFVAYAISYVRQFEAFVGERDSEALFNGMESEVSEPVAFIFKRLDFRNDDHGPSNASAYQTAAFDFSSLYSERTTNPLSLGRAYRTSGGTENTTNIREDSPGGLRIGYLESEEGELITALTDLADTEKIVFRPASGTDVVFTLSADNAVADNPATPDAGGFLSIASTSYTKTGTFIADTAYNLYPANSDGTIKGAQTDYPSNLPPQITGINIYRSTVVNEKVNAISFDQLTDLFENNPSDLDLSELLYRKIAYISRDELNLPFVDGLFALKGDDEDELVDSGDAIENITGYRPYYHTVEFDETDFSGVIVQPPPGVGIKESYNLPGIVVSIYGAGAPVEDIIAQDPLLALRAAEADSVYFYKWSDGLQLDLFDNQRLPPQVKQIHYHGGRIYAPRGDTLIYSHFDGTIPRFEAFPPKNDLPRPDGGRVTFCASHREVLLFGASDGLFRLTGQDRFDFATDQIGASGPLDGYSWGVFEQTIGFISDRGFHISDAASVDLVSDESLDGFLRGKTLTQGAVGFFTDNTLLFLAQTDDEDLLFLFDDKHWVRWKETALGQFAPRGGEIYVGGGETLKRIALGEESTAVDLAWSWESNLIHGQEAGASNVLKRFTELCIAAAPDTDMKLKTWINDDEISVDKNFTTREIGFDRVPQVVPIERVGQRLRFRLEGKGPVEIRGLEVRGEV